MLRLRSARAARSWAPDMSRFIISTLGAFILIKIISSPEKFKGKDALP
jgi:hypothetical protein